MFAQSRSDIGGWRWFNEFQRKMHWQNDELPRKMQFECERVRRIECEEIHEPDEGCSTMPNWPGRIAPRSSSHRKSHSIEPNIRHNYCFLLEHLFGEQAVPLGHRQPLSFTAVSSKQFTIASKTIKYQFIDSWCVAKSGRMCVFLSGENAVGTYSIGVILRKWNAARQCSSRESISSAILAKTRMSIESMMNEIG